MILYHGSNAVVICPRLVSQVRALDFGPGFYLTSDFEQAAFKTNRALACLRFEKEVAV